MGVTVPHYIYGSCAALALAACRLNLVLRHLRFRTSARQVTLEMHRPTDEDSQLLVTAVDRAVPGLDRTNLIYLEVYILWKLG